MTEKRVIDFMRSKNLPVLNKIYPGLVEGSIIESLNRSGNAPNLILIEHYKLMDGSKTQKSLIGELSLFPNGIPISLRQALALKKESKKERAWNESFFPLFENGLDDFLLIDSEDSNTPVYYYSPSNVDYDQDVVTIYDTYSSMWETIYQCYSKGIYKVVNNLLEVDFDLEPQVCKRLNPESEFWKVF